MLDLTSMTEDSQSTLAFLLLLPVGVLITAVFNGICEGSHQIIPKTRLKAIPWAKYCVEYASMLEKGLVRDDPYSTNTRFDYGDDEQDDDPMDTLRRAAI